MFPWEVFSHTAMCITHPTHGPVNPRFYSHYYHVWTVNPRFYSPQDPLLPDDTLPPFGIEALDDEPAFPDAAITKAQAT
jgi:hypothetical protein